MNTVGVPHRFKWLVQSLLLILFSLMAIVLVSQQAADVKAATAFEQTLVTDPLRNLANSEPVTSQINELQQNEAANANDALLIGSGITYSNGGTTGGPFYPGDLIHLVAQTKVQGTGNYFSNGHARILIDRNVFQPVGTTDVSDSTYLKNPPTITSDSNYYVINLDFKTIPTRSVGIDFMLHLKPGAVKNQSTYSVPIQYIDENGKQIYTNDTFNVQAKTDAPKLYTTSGIFNLDYTYWDGNKLNQDFTGTYAGNGFIYNPRTEPGDYTITLKIPDGYTISKVYGDATYDKKTNTITDHLNLNANNLVEHGDSDYKNDLFDFSIVYPKGTLADTKLPLQYTMTGSKNDKTETTIGVAKDDQPIPYFDAQNGKVTKWNNSSRYLDSDQVTDETPVVTTMTPVELGNFQGLNSEGTTGHNYAEVKSVTDTPKFNYSMKQLEMVDTDQLSTAFKKELNDNVVTATLDGQQVSLGPLRYGQPIDLEGKAYSNITITFKSPVRFDDPKQTGFQMKITGSVTQKAIDDFKNSSESKISWTNDLSTVFGETSEDKTSKSNVYHNPETASTDFGLTKPTPPAPEKPFVTFYNWQGMGIINNNGHQILGGQPFTSNFLFSTGGNQKLKLKPQNGKLILIVPDGITLGASFAGGLSNLRVENNFRGSGKNAIIGDITNFDDYVQMSNSNGISYQVSLKGEPGLVNGHYIIEGYLVFDNNNWEAFPKTDFHVDKHDAMGEDYGLYQNTNDPNSIFSATTDIYYYPSSSSLNINKISIKDKQSGSYGPYVSDTGQSLQNGDDFKYQSEIINNGDTDYNHLDLVDILPFDGDQKIGDAGGATSRGSNAVVHLTGPVEDLPGYKVQYSVDKPSATLADNYKATFVNADQITDWSQVRMIRVTADSGTILAPKQQITFNYPAVFADDAKAGSVAVNTFLMRKSDGDTLLESTPATARIAEPYSDVTIQFWGRKSDQDEYQPIASPVVKTHQEIGKSFPAKASDYPSIKDYVPVDNDDHGLKSVSSDPTQNVIKLYYKYHGCKLIPETTFKRAYNE
ncbi:hypothetical protein KTE19_11645 [Lentilactobacillus sp. IMAU92037]|uniref:hypothetical protein n=1 Tax=Lentilactobacillus dabitei TaxID=2831523 RepID=UPI001C2C4BA8|nr:hypothetical protein [Lentilactobacillus dabitei]MBV0931340.1 hypothetical protein [Lentilactobacillus dabitei]